MKKCMLLGMAALVMFALAGCQGEEVTGGEPDGPSTIGEWTTGINDFKVQTGDNPGEIKYMFNATNPAADEYTLYYMKGAINSAALIIATGKQMAQTPGAAEAGGFVSMNIAPASFTALSDLTVNASYSLVVEAKKGTKDDAKSGVKQVKAKEGAALPPQIKLTVNGIPATAGIAGASLLDDNFQPVAVSPNINGTFSFYAYAPTNNPPIGAAWRQTGTYYIALVDAMDATKVKATYTYIKGKYNFEQPTAALTWAEFKDQTQLALVISDIPASIGIIGASLLNDSFQPVAAGSNINGVFKFYTYGVQGPTNNIFTTANAYYIALGTTTDGSGANYIYITSQAPEKFTFSQQQTTAILTWNKFALQQQQP